MDQFAENMRAICAGVIEEFRDEMNDLKQSNTTLLKELEALQSVHREAQAALEDSKYDSRAKCETHERMQREMDDRLSELATQVEKLKSDNANVAKKYHELSAKMGGYESSQAEGQRPSSRDMDATLGGQEHQPQQPSSPDLDVTLDREQLERLVGTGVSLALSHAPNTSPFDDRSRFQRDSSPASTVTFGRPTPQVQRHHMHTKFEPVLSTVFSSAGSNAMPRASLPRPISNIGRSSLSTAEASSQGHRKRPASTSVLADKIEVSVDGFVKPQLPLRTSKRRKAHTTEGVTMAVAEVTAHPDLSNHSQSNVQSEIQIPSDDDNIVVKQRFDLHAPASSAFVSSLLRNTEQYLNGGAFPHSTGTDSNDQENDQPDQQDHETDSMRDIIGAGSAALDQTPRSALLSKFGARTSSMQAPKAPVLQQLEENITFARGRGQRLLRKDPQQNKALKDFVPLEHVGSGWDYLR